MGLELLQCSILEQSSLLGLLSCTPQAIQRRLNQIEVALRELEAEGKKLELALRNQSSE